MRITLNGLSKKIPESINLKNLIEQFCKDSKHVVAEVNGDIIKMQTWEHKKIENNDAIELVNIVGGG